MRKKAGSKNLSCLVSKWREACFLAENIKKSVIKYISIFKRLRFFFKNSLKRNQIFVRNSISTSLFRIFSQNKQVRLGKNVLNENKKRNGIYKNYNKKQQKFLNHDTSGFVAILICLLVPIILFGMKFSLNYATEKKLALHKKTTSANTVFKNCAEDAALAVAKNYNPGIELIYQYEGLLKVADAVYNNYPTHYNSSVGEAIPGLNRVDAYSVEQKGTFNPIKILNRKISAMNRKATEVVYSTNDRYSSQQKYTNYADQSFACVLWLYVDVLSSKELRSSILDEVDTSGFSNNEYILNQHEMFINPCAYKSEICLLRSYHCDSSPSNQNKFYNYPYGGSFTRDYNHIGKDAYVGSKRIDGTYTYRANPSDAKVKIEIDTKKSSYGCIKVTTDKDVGYAIPAECNVDIILAVPTNAAACNPDNLDTTSYPTAGQPWTGTATPESIPADAKNTPIYQIGQACKEFVKEFYHTRGTYMALIPYSGKVSLKGSGGKWGSYSSSRSREDWTTQIPPFNNNYFSHSTPHTEFFSVICGAALYSTKGYKYSNLYQSSYDPYARDSKNKAVLPIMSRLGIADTNRYKRYGYNYVYTGDLFSIAAPTTTATKFRQMPPNPCYMGYANMLSGECECTCDTYLPNPYYIVELTADLPRIYEFCNALYPFDNQGNVSNFIFIPVTWAANLLQPWSSDPGTSASPHTLSRPNKTTSGRKKVLILIVNKPDYFEQKELTYLGFNNDFAEIPISDSDCIRFDLDYSDSRVKDAYGNSFNGTIAGPKRILTFSGNGVSRNSSSGHYECDSGNGTLSFPQKGLIKVVVETGSSDSKWIQRNSGTTANLNTVTWSDGYFFAGGQDGTLLKSTDGINWSKITTNTTSEVYEVAYGKGILLALHGSGIVFRSENLSSGTIYNAPNILFYSINYGNGLFVMGGVNWPKIRTSSDGINWTERAPYYFYGSMYKNGLFVAGGEKGALTTSSDGINWTPRTSNISDRIDIMGYGNGLYLVAGGSGSIITSSDGATWKVSLKTSNYFYGAAYGGGIFLLAAHEKNDTSSSGQMFSTVDGTTLTAQNCPDITFGSKQFNHLTYSDTWERFVVVGNSGKIYTADLNGKPSGTIQFAGISSTMSQVSTQPYPITERTELFIEPSQLSGNSLQLKMQNIRLISAEITNRPYKIVPTTCYIKPSSDGTGNVYIYTTTKQSLTTQAIITNNAYVQIHNSNGVNKNVGFNSLIRPKTFSFSGSDNFKNLTSNSRGLSNFSTSGGMNFGHNLSVKKLKYTLHNAKLSSATLKNQLLRCYAHYYYISDGVNSKGIILNNIGLVSPVTNSTAEQYLDPCLDVINRTYNTYNGWLWNTNSPQLAQVKAAYFWPKCHGIRKGKFIMTASNLPVASLISGETVLRAHYQDLVMVDLADLKDFRSNQYYVMDLEDKWFDSPHSVEIATGAVEYKSSEPFKRYLEADLNVNVVYNQTNGDGDGCSKHILGSCKDCANYYCYVNTSCPSGYTNQAPSYFYSRTHSGGLGEIDGQKSHTQNGVTIVANANRNSMAFITCTKGCYFVSKSGNRGCYKNETCTKTYTPSGSASGCSGSGWTSNGSPRYSRHKYDLNNFFFLNSETKNYVGSVNAENDADLKRNKGIYSLKESEDTYWLCFCGDGDLDVTFSPLESSISYRNALNTPVTTNYKSNPTFTISPETHYYEKQENGLYRITLNVKNLTFISLMPTHSHNSYEYETSQVPEMSQTLNFSTNPFTPYNGGKLYENLHYFWGYNASEKFYTNHYSEGVYLAQDFNNIVGDYFCLVDLKQGGVAQPFTLQNGTWDTYFSRWGLQYSTKGLCRSFIDFYSNGNAFDQSKTWIYNRPILVDFYYLPTGSANLIMTGLTLPINSVLYYGYFAEAHKVNMQSDLNGNLITYDSSDAAKNATLRAIERFKANFGNSEIYIIKFRGQSFRKNPISRASVSENYEYLKNAATKFYEVSDENGLKSELKKIANEIKISAGYKEAKRL